MTGRRWFWLIVTICNALGIWKWIMTPGWEFFWLVVWTISFFVSLEAFIMNRHLTWERSNGNRK